MREIVALASKDLRLLLRDKAGFFFTLGFPLVYAVFFGVISSGFADSGGRSAIALAVFDEAGNEASRQLVAALEADPAIEVRRTDSVAEAEGRVRRGKVVAFLVVPEGFQGIQKSLFGGAPADFRIGVDPARQAEAGMLQGALMRAAFADMPENFRQPMTISRQEVSVKRWGPNNAYAVTFPQGIVWGIMGCAAGFGISLVVERRQGTLARLAMAPLSRAHVLAGKALACFLTVVVVAAGLLAFSVLVFGVRPGSFGLLALGIACNGIAFVGIMMLLSVVGKTEQAAGGIGWAILVTMAMIGGGMIPLFVMPQWLQGVASVSPVKWAILAMEGAIWRGFSLAEMLLPCGILLGVGAGCFAVGVSVFRWSDR